MDALNQCPICNGASYPFDVVDFGYGYPDFWQPNNKVRIEDLNLSLHPVYYFQCQDCAFTYSPEIAQWSDKEFAEKIYNDNFLLMDVDAIDKRPRANATSLHQLFGGQKSNITHLDYGGGTGLLSNLLIGAGWNSANYEPYLGHSVSLNELGKFNLITCYEVFEHAPSPSKLIRTLSDLLEEEGMILFSTQLSDQNLTVGKRIAWWYATPCTGHISLFSYKSLETLGKKFNFNFKSFNAGFHCFYKKLPRFADSIVHLFP